jgi:hypothetical protein
LADDAPTPPSFQGTHGDTTYYFFETQDLPLFAPLRIVGVPESVIDVVEPFFREIVELGYDRSIPPWEPTPARLIPMHNPATVAADLVNAIGEGINNALAHHRFASAAAPEATAAGPSEAATKSGNGGRKGPDDHDDGERNRNRPNDHDGERNRNRPDDRGVARAFG